MLWDSQIRIILAAEDRLKCIIKHLVLHTTGARILLMYHHRHLRWLLPGGHVEAEDATLPAAAAREACEETGVEIAAPRSAELAGVDVHGIPARKNEPYHLHHDLVFVFDASSDKVETTAEAPFVRWASVEDARNLGVAQSIQRVIERAIGMQRIGPRRTSQ